MKKFVFLLAILFAMQTALLAQLTDTEPVVFNAHLLETFNLNIDVPGATQEITFAVAADYNNGVFEAAGIVPGISHATVEATGNWELTILCPDFVGGNGGAQVIPINNLGVWCDDLLGTHKFGGEVTCAYQNAAASLGLSTGSQVLIGLGSGNAGDITDNHFVLHWRMGTRDNASMNPLSMFDQLAVPDFTTGDYTTTALLTITQQ
jgi:hypothetical protein